MRIIVFFSLLVCLAFCPPLPAGGPFPYTLSVAPQFGLLYGQGEEQVFGAGSSDELLSQLLWDIKPLYYGGLRLEFARKKPLEGFGLFSSLSFKFGFPMETGIMEDRDWTGPAGELTSYSRHDALNNGAVIVDLAAGPGIPAGPFLALRLSLGLSYTRFAWTARNGYIRQGPSINGVDSPLRDSDPSRPLAGNMVSYSQECLFMPLGLYLSVLPDRLFSGALWFYGGPVLKFVGRDDHLNRTRASFQNNPGGDYGQFLDEMTGGYVLEPGGEFRFSPGERLSLRLYGSWRLVSAKSRGKTFASFTGETEENWIFLGNSSGGRFRTMDLGIGLEVSL
jgi:outer membrane protease